MTNPIEKWRRHLPHWRQAGATYFVTFRVHAQPMSPAERDVVVQNLKAGDRQFYSLVAFVVMPDHLHLILRDDQRYPLDRILAGIKGTTARKVNRLRSTQGAFWQDESWDRILRDAAELDEKLQYIWNNPLKAGLCDRPEDYPWSYLADPER